MVKGITQRVLAINFFLTDIYGQQEIIKHGVIPVDLIQNNPAFLKQMVGFTPPKKTYNHISGIDLIKTNSDNFYVLEDNVFIMYINTKAIPSDVKSLFKNMPQNFQATRYHSLIVEKKSLPKNILITSKSPDNYIMSIEILNKMLSNKNIWNNKKILMM